MKVKIWTSKIYFFGPKGISKGACQIISVTNTWCHRKYPLYNKQNLKPALKFLTPLFPEIFEVCQPWPVSTNPGLPYLAFFVKENSHKSTLNSKIFPSITHLNYKMFGLKYKTYETFDQ